MRYSALIASVLVLVLAACQQVPVEIPDTPTVQPVERAAPTAPGVTRMIMKDSAAVGEPVTVKLYINLQPGETYYLFDENVSKDLRVGGQEVSPDNHIRVVIFQDAVSRVEEYTVTGDAPGTYTFAGEYAIEGNLSIMQIMGDNSLTVR